MKKNKGLGKNIYVLIMVLSHLLASCSTPTQRKVDNNTPNGKGIIPENTLTCDDLQDIKILSSNVVKTFYRTFTEENTDIEIMKYSSLSIIDNQYLIDELDMDYYAFVIDSIEYEGDSIITITVNREISYVNFFKGIVEDRKVDFSQKKEAKLERNNENYLWSIKYNDNDWFSYYVIDSLDVNLSGYSVDLYYED